MIRRIKKKYITAIMIFVVIVISLIIAIINITNFVSVDDRANIRLDFIIETQGLEPPKNTDDSDETEADKAEDDDKTDNGIITEETPFDLRYFTVPFDSRKIIVGADVRRVAAVSHEEAVTLARRAYNKGISIGYMGDYKYRSISYDDGSELYVFLDASRELNAFRSFCTSSIIVSVCGIAVIFILLIILSNTILGPIIESYEKQRRFITDAGHELKTPLAIIEANTDVLELEYGEDEWTSSIKNQTHRLARLTENLVYLSKMEEADFVKKFETFDMSSSVMQVAESWRIVAESKGKKIDYSIKDDIMIKGSENDIMQLTSILLDNAVKYSDKEGNINLTLTDTALGIELSVKNTVEEIEQGNLPKLFDRFYRRESSRNSKMGGSGIGLSSAKSIVQNHKGKISARSDDGKSLVITAVF